MTRAELHRRIRTRLAEAEEKYHTRLREVAPSALGCSPTQIPDIQILQDRISSVGMPNVDSRAFYRNEALAGALYDVACSPGNEDILAILEGNDNE